MLKHIKPKTTAECTLYAPVQHQIYIAVFVLYEDSPDPRCAVEHSDEGIRGDGSPLLAFRSRYINQRFSKPGGGSSNNCRQKATQCTRADSKVCSKIRARIGLDLTKIPKERHQQENRLAPC